MSFQENKGEQSKDILIAEYEGAWKQIEYNMHTNWQFLGMLLSLAVAANFVGNFFQGRTSRVVFFWISVVVFVVLGYLYFLFFERNRAVSHLHSIRRLEIEAQLGMRANWREYVDRKELEPENERWISDGVGEFKREGIRSKEEKDKVAGRIARAAKRIVDSNYRCVSPDGLLNRIARQKRVYAAQDWPVECRWMSARYLVYAGGVTLVCWILAIIYLGIVYGHTAFN